MLVSQKVSEHIGKVIKSIESESEDLSVCENIKIVFKDDSTICLGLDWRGSNCYISQYED